MVEIMLRTQTLWIDCGKLLVEVECECGRIMVINPEIMEEIICPCCYAHELVRDIRNGQVDPSKNFSQK